MLLEDTRGRAEEERSTDTSLGESKRTRGENSTKSAMHIASVKKALRRGGRKTHAEQDNASPRAAHV